jgi:histidine triad (HIT) family protein
MSGAYDDNNVFAKILRGEIPAKPLFENTHALAFADLYPKAPVHVLVIPKGPYITMDHLMEEGSAAEISDFYHAVAEIVRLTGVKETGYRLVSNNGHDGGQEVPHFHVHVLGGKHLKHPQQEAE